MKKRVFCAILSIILVLALFPISVHAEDDPDIRTAIIEACEARQYSLNLEAYSITPDELSDIFSELRCDNELPWYVDSYSYDWYPDTGLVAVIRPTYLDPDDYDWDLYERTVAEILAETVHPGMSQWQICLSIHDYLVSHYHYDETYTYYEGYDLLVGGTAVCAGYAFAYMDLLKRAGIDAVYRSSVAMDHAWVSVNISGNWYHVDPTWDDPTSDCHGRVMHDYFLISDSVISDEEHEHYGWGNDEVCSDTYFDTDSFWQGINSQIIYTDAENCYFRYTDGTWNGIYHRAYDGTETLLTEFNSGYIDIGEGRYHYTHHGLSLWNERLYFSDMTRVYSTALDGSDLRTEFSYDAEGNGRFIYGSFVDDGRIYLTLSDQDWNTISMEVPLDTEYTGHVHSYTGEVVEATCADHGYTVYTCQCGVSYQGDWTDPNDSHTYDDGVVTNEPSAIFPGTRLYTCIRCGSTMRETIPALGGDTDSGNHTYDSGDEEMYYYLGMAAAGLGATILLRRKKKK